MFNLGVPFMKAKSLSEAVPTGTLPTNTTAPVGNKDNIQNIIAPQKIEIDLTYIKINDKYLRTIFVGGYPRFVSPGWLDPIINFDHSLDLSFFIYPVEGKTVLDDLRRKIAEMEAEIATDLQRGRVVNPGTQAKLEDARDLQEQLVKGAERFFQFSFYITIQADSLEDLNQITHQVQSTLGSLLIVAKFTALQMEDGLLSTTPLGIDKLSITRNMDTTSLATTFPFVSAELSSDRGVLYGINEDNDSLVIFDRFRLENYNSLIFATSGAGKSTSGNEPVLYRNHSGEIKLGKIGNVVEKIIKKGVLEKIDEEMEGVVDPGIEVYAFDKYLKGNWSKVSIAARKIAPKTLYKVRTKSGREITITADHNLVILKNGKISIAKADEIESGDYIPLPRKIETKQEGEKSLNVYKLLSNSKIKYLKTVKGRVGNRLAKDGTTLPRNFPLSEDFFKFLGYFVSEGNATKQRVLISNTDKVVLNDVAYYFKALGINYSIVRKQEKAIGIHTFSEPFRELLAKLGTTRDSSKKNVPPLVFTTDNKRAASFLQGYFEGDGGVDGSQITATTKSKQLASDLSYLLLRFGIIARIAKTKKRATNGVRKRKSVYWKVSISGQENIKKFTDCVGFVSERKSKQLRTLVKNGNTNVDVIPELGSILKDIYQELYNSEIPAPKKFSEIKLGIFKPSRKELLKLIAGIEKRVAEIEALETDGLLTLQSLPTLEEIWQKAKKKEINSLLWHKLSSSWAVMKKREHPPLLASALQAASVTHQTAYNTEQISSSLYRSFRVTGESLLEFDKSLWASVVVGSGNTNYSRVLKARDFISKAYKNKKEGLVKIKQHLVWLKILSTSDLFWDPIVSIKKIKSRDKYVYDLTVDDQVFLAGFGGMFVHNSYAVKLEAVRSLMLGTEVFIIDPEAEYKPLTEAVGGEFISFSFNSPAKINPFELTPVSDPEESTLGLKILSLHSLFSVIMGKLSPTEEALMDRAFIATYKAKGITPDPQTQTKTPPLMEDLYKTLLGMEDPIARSLADRIEKFIKGSFAGIFDQHTNIDLKNPFTTFSVRDLEETLRPIAMFVILDFIWNRIKRDLKKRLLIVDEAWHMMRYPDTAQFLYSVAKRSRKYYLGLITITQDVEDFLSQDIGRAIVTNSALKLLMKQSPAAIERVAEVFKLSEGEKQLLLAADVGEGIFFAGPNHVALRIVASEEEHALISTKPEEVLLRQRKEQEIQTPTAIPITVNKPIYQVEEIK